MYPFYLLINFFSFCFCCFEHFRNKLKLQDLQQKTKERRRAQRRKRPVSKKIEDPYLTWQQWIRKPDSKRNSTDTNASKWNLLLMITLIEKFNVNQ
jgi:hypothetical protein